MKMLLLGFALATVAAAIRPTVKRGYGCGDRDYEYVSIEFPRVGFEIDWWIAR